MKAKLVRINNHKMIMMENIHLIMIRNKIVNQNHKNTIIVFLKIKLHKKIQSSFQIHFLDHKV